MFQITTEPIRDVSYLLKPGNQAVHLGTSVCTILSALLLKHFRESAIGVPANSHHRIRAGRGGGGGGGRRGR